MGRDKSFKVVATEYGDLNRLAQTADSMGAHQSAQAYREEASEVRQGFFGQDPKPKK